MSLVYLIKRRSAALAAVMVLYTLLTLIWSWPLPARLSTHYAGDDMDVWINPWANWWTKKALSEGLDFYQTDYLFYPRGTSLHFHSFSHVNTGLWLVLEPWLGAIAAMNVTTLLAYVLSGWSVYVLTLYLTGDHWASFVAGCLYTFSPWHIEQSSHPVINTTQWLPLALLALFKLIRQKSVGWAIAGAIFVWLSALSSWHLLTFALLLLGLYLPYSLWAERERWDTATLGRLAGMALAALILIGPFIYPLLRQTTSGTADISTRVVGRSVDLLGLVTPHQHHPLWGQFMPESYGPIGAKKSVYLGWGGLLAACYAVWCLRRRVVWWALVSGLFFILSLGPYLQVGGQPIEAVRFPWGDPLTQFIRATDRFQILLTLTLAVLAGYGLADLRQRTSRRPRARLGLWLLGGVLLFDLAYYPFPHTRLDLPEFYRQTASDSGSFAVLNLPMREGPVRHYMYYQTFYEKPLVNGVVSRISEEAFDYIEAHPLLHGAYVSQWPDPRLNDVSRQLMALADDDVRYLILHKNLTPAKRLAKWQDYLVARPFYQDEMVLVYRTMPPHGLPPPSPDGLEGSPVPIQVDVAPTHLTQGGVLNTDVHWYAPTAPEQDQAVRLSLVDLEGTLAQSVTLPVCQGWPTAEWPTDAVAIGHYPVQVDPHLEVGEYNLTWSLIDAQDKEVVGEPAPLTQIRVEGLPRQFGPVTPTVPLKVDFEEQLRLLGYDLIRTGDGLTLTLHWQALERMSQSYKVFVHLYDPETGEIVAQEDVIPRRWTYPTTWWQTGEVVSDPIPLSLEAVASGTWHLAVGVYDPGTGERLFPRLKGAPNPDARLILPEEVVK